MTADGRALSVLATASPVRDGSEIVGALVVFQDITEKQEAAEALRVSEERLRLAQSGAGIGLWDWDVETGLLTLSPDFQRPFHVRGEATRPRECWLQTIHSDDRATVEAELQAVLISGGPLDLEFRLLAPSGEARWLSLKGRGIAGDEGIVTRVLGVTIDVTERKEAELALARAADDLRRSNEELERFAYVASHDLQGPLRTITAFSELLDQQYRGRLGAEADDYLRFIIDGGTRMQSMIDDLLASSRVGAAVLPAARTDPNEVVAGVLASLDATVRDAGAAVVVGQLPAVMADRSQLAQVFANLIMNAIKFHRPGVPPEVRIGAARLESVVKFSVADNGIGIAPDHHDRIFEMFARLHTHDEYGGTGIGLAVVKRIVERHGGEIRVESSSGQGSTFLFTLPAAEASEPMETVTPPVRAG
jgi:PAS domain S-box-containing protein